MIKLSVVICTYNPNRDILKKVLEALRNQTLTYNIWELIIVNNNSTIEIPEFSEIKWHNNIKVIFEEKPGLVHARISGFNQCEPASLIVFVDDDNVLNNDYLELCLAFSLAHKQVGCFGGKSLPKYESTPPNWFGSLGINLGCQDFGDEQYISAFKSSHFKIDRYPDKAPIGTGMAVKYDAFLNYIENLNQNKLTLGRKGTDQNSAEDNDIVLTIIKSGFEIAYVPNLIVKHIIPQKRYTLTYLKDMAYKSNISWIKVLEMHQINPHKKIPKWTVWPRQIRSWFKLKAWRNETNYIKWKGACGVFKGLSEI